MKVAKFYFEERVAHLVESRSLPSFEGYKERGKKLVWLIVAIFSVACLVTVISALLPGLTSLIVLALALLIALLPVFLMAAEEDQVRRRLKEKNQQ